ncbi:NAD(P)/FAD-dependent oxidoreductase [Enterococcus asini]|uniref:NAD(P)/FAD-dependent oxidoreductase n=1 Tax=Enterococcus asini TaxID=57732 RepID=UPI002890EF99|nr:NAD(P)/FAD-dependent oxidoreductase [Enterococcus asini]MDT2756218.1 NAD(P)/FAD-dependent oxidoreductase [Enterococcus asini]
MEKKYDVIVIGAGPAGLMSAIAAGQQGASVLLLEKNKKPGKKLRMTGGGRCNVTNNRPEAELIEHIPGNGRFLYSTFAQWNNQDIMAFFASHNIPLKEEDHGRMFPVSDRSKTIVDTLVNAAVEVGVELQFNCPVTKLITKDNEIQGVRCETGDIAASCVIITTGGKTYPGTGSTGDGYLFAKGVGHSITPLFATEAPLVSEEPFIKAGTLQGLSLQDVALSVLSPAGKKIITQEMDLLFTHFGLSGPAALRCAYFINRQLRETNEAVLVSLDSLPKIDSSALLSQLEQQLQTKKQVKNALAGLVPERLLHYFLTRCELMETTGFETNKSQVQQLVNLLKAFPITIQRTIGLEKAFVTAGGVALKEVVPKTLESKLCAGLFFAGEVLDINGYTGGYNITAALCTGHVAGIHAAEIAGYWG